MFLGISFLAWIGLIVASVAIGYAVQALFRPEARFEWLVVALGFGFGALLASEMLPGTTFMSWVTNWGPEIEGLVIVPAIIGGIIVGLVGELGMRAVTEPSPA